MKKNKTMKGILINYFATGEMSRPQFIGLNSLDEKGRLKNYDEVYDIIHDDQVILTGKQFTRNKFVVDTESWSFLHILTCSWNSEEGNIEAEFVPTEDHKGWGAFLK